MFGFLARLALSVIFMVVAVRAVDLDALMASVGRLDPLWLVAAIAAFAAQIPLAAWRWRRIAASLAEAPPYRVMLRWCFIAHFFNQTLPTTVGGDAVRVWLMMRAGRKLGEAASIVLADRVVGVSALLLIVALAVPVQAEAIADKLARSALNAATAAGLAGVAGLILLARPQFTLFDRVAPLRGLRRMLAPLAALQARPLTALALLAMSMMIHVLTFAAVASLARGFQLPVAASALAILVPPVLLVSTMPLSIAGWGLREVAMVTALGFVSVAPDAALSVSLMMGVVLLIVGTPGGILWAVARSSCNSTATGARDAVFIVPR